MDSRTVKGIQREVSGISAFDLDKTLIKGNCNVLFFYFLYNKGVLSSPIIGAALKQVFYRYVLQKPVQKVHYCVLKLLSQFSGYEILRWVDNFVETFSEKWVYKPAVWRLREAQRKGHFTALLSNSPNFLVERFAQYFCINQSYASKYIMDGFGQFSRISYLVSGQQKANFLQNLQQLLKISIENTFAYSDSLIDLPFLEQAGHAVVVQPERKLWHIARQKKWEVI